MKEDMLGRMRKNAENNSIYLSPDVGFLGDLIQGLVTNEERYGYPSCPCRVACGIEAYDADIICPCEYRDADVAEFGACYCALFVSKEVHEGKKVDPTPERRPIEVIEAAEDAANKFAGGEVNLEEPRKSESDIKVWRCTVCGYLSARKHPPSVCPICKAPREKFEEFSFG